MLAPPIGPALKDGVQQSAMPAELEFYQSYDWCLNRYLTVSEAIRHLGEEVDKLSVVPNDWQISEVVTNIFLLACGLLNCIDGYLRGPVLNLPSQMAASIVGRSANRFMEQISEKRWSQRRIGRWRERLLSDLNDFLSLVVGRQAIDTKCLAESGRRLKVHLRSRLPADLRVKRLATPSPFSHLDLTSSDVLSLGECFVRRFPERAQPIALLGLRTSGSYFAVLLRAFFQAEGYESVALLTVEPNKGVSRREKKKLERLAAHGYLALIVDDPPHTSRTLHLAAEIARRAGFVAGNVKLMAPTHTANPTWFETLAEQSVITLLPEQWYKRELLTPKVVERRLAEYFGGQHFSRVFVTASRRADEFNMRLQGIASDARGVRLKRIFEVQLETSRGERQTKYVLAKSVGWGWLSYHAFLIGQRLTGYVPPILGLRDGILYTEWISQPAVELGDKRSELITASASYVAARVHHLNLTTGSEAGLDLKRHNNGSRMLEKVLSRAYGRFPVDMLERSHLGGLVRKLQCPFPTLIDGNMHCGEWILGPRRPLKTDYEHHGMGKTALNVIDPAYDLADTILSLALSREEERDLITQYIASSDDATVGRRLFMHKLLAGLWAMSRVQEQLFASPRGGDGQLDLHRHFMNAWNFLTVQTARHIGSLCHSWRDPRWRAPLVVLDVDGVIDRRLFGFPSTTAAGIKALSLLNAHGFSVALNTARSATEVREYCKAYSLAGGVAEHGSYLWDAVRQREHVLISSETERQLAELRRNLQRIPGVFLDERHRYSIRAFTYCDKPSGLMQSLLSSARSSSIGDGALAPISTHIVHQLLADLRLDRLAFHHTMIDTAIIAKDIGKGTGLAALRDWVVGQDAETIAVGDSEPDLAMFRVAHRSFAPAHIGCRHQARLLGCQIASYPYQQGLLEIVRNLVHADDGRAERFVVDEMTFSQQDDLFTTALQAADRSWTVNLLKAMFHPAGFRALLR